MRKRLIEAAIRQFGDLGYEGASTRGIAAAADTTMSNITYHFGGKEGLYVAAGEEILERMNSAFADNPVSIPDGDITLEERLELVCQILRNMGGFMLSSDVEPMARFVAREHGNPGSRLGQALKARLMFVGSLIAEQVAYLRPDLDRDQQRMTAFYLYSMAVSPKTAHAQLLTIMGVEKIDDNLRQLIVEHLVGLARQILSGGGR